MRYSTYNAIPQYPKSKKHPYETLEKSGVSGLLKSFPLDGRGGLGAEVVEDAVDVGDFGEDAVGDLHEQGPLDLGDCGGHGVYGVHGADDDRPGVDALAVADAGARDGRHHCEILPHGLVQARLRELLAQDGVGLANGFQAVAGYRAHAPHAQARSRERLAVHHGIRQAQRLADHAHLVFEQEL